MINKWFVLSCYENFRMHLLSSILTLLFVCLTINPGKTQIFRNSGKNSNSNALQGNYIYIYETTKSQYIHTRLFDIFLAFHRF